MQAWLLQKAQKDGQALEICSSFKAQKGDPWEPELIRELQHIFAQCQLRLGKKGVSAGADILALWTNALDRSKSNSVDKIRREMLKAAIRDDYWDLLQNVSQSKVLS